MPNPLFRGEGRGRDMKEGEGEGRGGEGEENNLSSADFGQRDLKGNLL